jgi:hypothetical protein
LMVFYGCIAKQPDANQRIHCVFAIGEKLASWLVAYSI